MVWQRFWRTVHIYISMFVLLIFLFFALTGITLNHPEWQLAAGKSAQSQQLQLPENLQQLPFGEDALENAKAAGQIADWLRAEHQVEGAVFAFNYEPDEQLLELDFKQPAGFANAQIELTAGIVQLDREFAGYLTLLNDLHKGRYTGSAWKWLIDIVAVCCLIFAISGFYLLWRQPSRRFWGMQAALTGLGISLLVYLAALH